MRRVLTPTARASVLRMDDPQWVGMPLPSARSTWVHGLTTGDGRQMNSTNRKTATMSEEEAEALKKWVAWSEAKPALGAAFVLLMFSAFLIVGPFAFEVLVDEPLDLGDKLDQTRYLIGVVAFVFGLTSLLVAGIVYDGRRH